MPAASSDVATVLAFNDAINRRDLAALAGLMTPDHRFIDPGGVALDGQDACVEAWRGFFDQFPDYRNVVAEVVDVGGGTVRMSGRSDCREPALDGPARWRAEVVDGRVAVWQVSELPAAPGDP